MTTENNSNIVAIPEDALSTENVEITKHEQETPGQCVIKLTKPFCFEEETFTELVFNFNKLSGNDALAIEDELNSLGKPVISPTFSGPFLIRMAARACTTTYSSGRHIGIDLLQALPITEFTRIRSKARTFLLNAES